MTVRVLVVDDEPLAREMVANFLRRDQDVERVIECGDAHLVADLMARHDPHIVFLDVEMPELNGIAIAKTFPDDGPVVVFITAFSEYAAQAFDVRATDYVLKPFSDRRLSEAIARAKRRVQERRLGGLAAQMATLAAEMHPDEHPRPNGEATRSERLSRAGRSIVLKTAEVIRRGRGLHVLIHSARPAHGARDLVLLEQRLDPRAFLRVHRAALVNLHEVQEIREDGGLSLVLSDGSQVAVSRSRRERVDSILRPRFRT